MAPLWLRLGSASGALRPLYGSASAPYGSASAPYGCAWGTLWPALWPPLDCCDLIKRRDHARAFIEAQLPHACARRPLHRLP